MSMLPTKVRFIWPSGFRGEDFFRNQPIRNKNCLVNGSGRNEQLYQVTVHLAKQFQWVSEEFEDTKGVIQISVSQKNRKHNCQKKKIQNDKQWSTKHTYKTKDHRVTQIPLKTGDEIRWSVRVNSSFSTSSTRRVDSALFNNWNRVAKIARKVANRNRGD